MNAIRTYFSMMKPGIIFGNFVTAAGGFILASSIGFQIDLFLSCMVGLCLIIGAGCVLNNYFDRISDQKMTRTQTRVLVQGIVSEEKAVLFGFSLLFLGSTILIFRTNFLATMIAMLGFIVYVAFYTFLKHKTVYGTEIGSIAGAVPPVVGYTAVSGSFDMGAFLLFLIVALWQMPHFFAIALYRMDDYASAKIPVLPLEKGIYTTKIRMFVYALCFMVAVSLLTVYQFTGYWYLSVALSLSLSWLWTILKGFWTKNDHAWAKQVFFVSLVVIMGLSLMIAIDRV